ncbi:OmpA family protein [Chitinimonas sp. BJB300]|uniref:OmpA family protein n=1 Tax=Chitinimonas sp. BJB300 TaxID=1559339 RepID=UPI001304277D|nr:OmpA family protein [Chitinimonas sp. BJB300]
MKIISPHLLLIAVVLLAACQSLPPLNPDLELAKRQYAEASSDAMVAENAASELERARLVLNQGEKIWLKDRDVDEVRHLSYLTQQRIKIARETAASRNADKQASQASLERARLLASDAQQQADSKSRRVAMLEQALAAKQTDRGLVVTLNDVLFDFGRANLRPSGLTAVRKLAMVMRDYPERRVLVEGHADSTGPTEYNQTLSERRAEEIKKALIAQNIESTRIEVRGYGASYPVADNNDASGRQQNRRVEIVVSDAQGQLKAR